jgi:hypothetical protein
MNHPNHEELAEGLYGELAPERQRELDRHLADCADCRARVESWRALRRELGTWTISERRPAAAPGWRYERAVRWAAAAAALFVAGFGLARWTAPRPDTASLRTALVQELRGDLRNEWGRFAAEQDRRQEQFQQTLTTTLGRLEARRLTDYADLRRDMETMAVHAEDELLTTRQSLNRLAALETPPAPPVP